MAEMESIAIVGMSGLFPKAPDVTAFWSNILNKVDAITEASDEWLGTADLLDANCAQNVMQMYTRAGGFLQDLARFDPRPFGTMPVAIDGAEPDQFLALACAVDALKDAGMKPGNFNNERTGIILGHAIHANRGNVNGIQHGVTLKQIVSVLSALFPNLTTEQGAELERMMKATLPAMTVDTAPGLVPNMMSGRIANRLDLMGPNYIMDAACASSLLAIKTGVEELRTGRADVMLAGGINTSTSTLVYILFSQLGALARSSRVRPFSTGSDGTLLGEGQGIVVMKRLEDALRDGDRVYAVIRGIGASSDGRSAGLMAPRLEGEILAIRRAYEQSGIDPASISLIEAHGTGIPLGDRTEVQALRTVFGDRKGVAPTVALGSVKSMIGHCIPAAGSASVIKMAMALHHKILPPTLSDGPNPDLGLESTPFYLNTEPAPWISGKRQPRRAAVNAFGFGGINSHLILEEAPGSDGRDATAAFGLRPMHTPELVTLAAPTRDGLLGAISALQARLAETPLEDLRAIAAHTAAEPARGDQRLAIVATDRDDLAKKLTASAKRLADAGLHQFQTRNGIQFNDEPVGGKVAFLFPGENSQYPGMLKDLALLSPAVRHWFDRLDDLFLGERDVPHRTMIFPPPTCVTPEEEAALEGRLRRVDFGSESVFFADQALLTLLRLFGVKPDFMVGHSTGENSALIASGIVVMSRDEVCDYVHRMNEIFKRLEDSDVIPSGTLLTIGAAERSDIEQALANEPSLLFTMDNCPNQAILCGPKDAVDRAAARLTERGAICSTLPMSWAYHTPFVAPMADAFKDLFSGSKYGEPEARLYSCASAGPFPSEPEKILRLACDQYVSPVRFADTIERLYEDGARVFIEVGPQSNLTGFVRDILRKRPHLAVSLNSDRRSAFEQFLLSLAQLFVHQVPFDAGKLYAEMPASPAKPAGRAPALKSELPYVRLSPQNLERMREILGVSGGASPAAAHPAEAAATPPAVAVPPPAPAAVAAPQSAPAAPRPIPAALPTAPAPVRRGPPPAALSRHLTLMDEMLASSESVTRSALRRRPSARRAVKTWSGNLPLPHPAATEFASLASWAGGVEDDGALATLARSVLPALDLASFEQDIARTSPRRQRDWLAGRIAARNALLTWCGRNGEDGAVMEIAYDGEGRPIARGPNGANGVYLSISHKDGVAVAAAANRPVGIDLERLAPLRNTEGFLQVAFGESEIELLRADLAVRPDVTAVIAWSAKEAAAKAFGQKLLGREQTFRIVAFDSARRQIRLTWDTQRLDVTYYVDGRFVCCFATSA